MNKYVYVDIYIYIELEGRLYKETLGQVNRSKARMDRFPEPLSKHPQHVPHRQKVESALALELLAALAVVPRLWKARQEQVGQLLWALPWCSCRRHQHPRLFWLFLQHWTQPHFQVCALWQRWTETLGKQGGTGKDWKQGNWFSWHLLQFLRHHWCLKNCKRQTSSAAWPKSHTQAAHWHFQ